MEFELSWGGDPEDLLVRMSGVAQAEDLEALREAVEDPRWRPGLRVLLDERQLDWSEMSSADIERRAAFLAENRDLIGHNYTAVVTSKSSDFGMLRMEQALIERRVPYELGIFRTLEEARAWLRSVPTEAQAPPTP